jgi:uncharacterized membrane protein YphA (DoxX/SURF4 family)
VLSEPLHVALLGSGALAAVVAMAGYLRYRPARRDIAVFRATMDDYRDLLPWLLRLRFGLPLVVGLVTRADAMVALVLFTLTLFGFPDDPVLAHVSLFGLASALIITGSGPLALDRRLADQPDRQPADPGSAADD